VVPPALRMCKNSSNGLGSLETKVDRF